MTIEAYERSDLRAIKISERTAFVYQVNSDRTFMEGSGAIVRIHDGIKDPVEIRSINDHIKSMGLEEQKWQSLPNLFNSWTADEICHKYYSLERV